MNRKLLEETVARWNRLSNLTYKEVSAQLGMHRTTLMRRLATAAKLGISVEECTAGEAALTRLPLSELVELPEMPEPDIPVEEIVKQRIREFQTKKRWEEANRLLPIKVKVPGTIAIWWFGDPHLDDDGCDIGEAFRHAELTRKHNWLFGANIGDTTNNWVGRLGHLYSQQNMGKARGLRVAEHWLKLAKFLLVIDGNHDAWSGDDNPIQWIMRGGGGIHRPDGLRVRLDLPAGEPVLIHARHDFAGHSQWNGGHGPMKAFKMGTRDHLKVSGHKHESFETKLKDPETGIVSQILKVASYKVYDRYAKQLGLADQHLSPGAMTTIRPELAPTHPDRIKVYWDIDEGVEYMKWARR
jgi:hypothetical protein